MQLKLNILFLHLILIIVHVNSKSHSPKDCDCYNSETSDKISKIETVLRTVVKAIADRTYLINEVKYLNVWKESQAHVTEKLKAELQQVKERLEVEVLPSSQPLVGQPEEKMQRDSEAGSGGFEEDRKDVPKEVSELLAKVEEVENRTIQVQQKLESERRVRRHLEESLNETRTSVHILGDKLQNITVPDNNKMTQVEEVLLTTLENINKTLFEDHLQKLYYKIDGVVYRNETKLLNERLDLVEIEVHENNYYYSKNSNLTQLTMMVKMLEDNMRQINDSIQSELMPRYNASDSETAQTKRLKTLEERFMIMSNMSDVLKEELEEIRSYLESSTNLRKIFLNLTEEWRLSLSNIGQQVNDLKKGFLKENDLPIVNKSTTNVVDESDIKDIPISTACKLPQIYEPNLLVHMDTDKSGNQNLQFGCIPVGQYILKPSPIPTRCENGTWQGGFPTCIKLHTEDEIQSLSINLEKFNPCLNASGTFEDPTNCSRFFMCTHNQQLLTSCLGNLHYIAAKKQCVFPYNSGCTPFSSVDATSELHYLKIFVPPIHIRNLDRPYGLVGTSLVGEIVVYPGTTLTLQCLFPNTVFGHPKWFVYKFQTGLEEERDSQKEGLIRFNLKISAAKVDDSGVYICKTPYGKETSVTVIVKEVSCPPITDSEDIEKAVFYRPTPEGQSRIISTSALFQCEDGQTITAFCLADGTWSRTAPTDKECQIKDTRANIFWGCPPLDFQGHPHLVVERIEKDTKLIFSCEEELNLIGPPSIVCIEGQQWSQTSLPKCEQHGKSYIGDQSINDEYFEDN